MSLSVENQSLGHSALENWAGKRNVAFGILDHDRLKNTPFVYSESITRRMLQLHNKFAREKYLQGPDIDALICSAAAHGYSYLLVQEIGHYLRNPAAFVDCVEEAMDGSALAVGHLLGDQVHGLGLDTQCLLVDLNVWKQIGKPGFNRPQKAGDSRTTASGPGHRGKIKQPDGEAHNTTALPGTNFVRAARDNGVSVVPFPAKAVQSSRFLAPGDALSYAYNLEEYQEERHSLSEALKLFDRDIFNPGLVNREPPGSIFSVASGFSVNMLLEQGGPATQTVIVYFDSSEVTLRFKQWQVARWNGYDYPNAIRRWTREQGVEAQEPPEYLERQWEHTVTQFGGKESFARNWKTCQKLSHHFLHLNLLSRQHSQLLRLLPRAPAPRLLNWSNVFHSVYTHSALTVEQTWLIYADWTSRLCHCDPDLYIYGCDPWERDVTGYAGQIDVRPARPARNLYFPAEVLAWFEKEISEWALK